MLARRRRMRKKARAPAIRAKTTTPPTTPPAIAPALLFFDDPLVPPAEGAAVPRPVAVDDAVLETVPAGIEEDAVASGVSTVMSSDN